MTQRWALKFFSLSLALILLAVGAEPGNAQIVPGARAPTDMVDAAIGNLVLACRLASARHPVGGINMSAGRYKDEWLTEQATAPDWVEAVSAAQGPSRFATLVSPQGEIWIRFDETTARCSIIVRPPDVAQFRAAFADSMVRGSSTKRETAADGSESFVTEAPEFSWISRMSVPAATSNVVLIETSFAKK